MEMRQQECFAIRPGISGNLDVVRQVYSGCVNDILQLVEQYRSECEAPKGQVSPVVPWSRLIPPGIHSSSAGGIESLQLHHNVSRGFHLTLPGSSARNLPTQAIQCVQRRAGAAVFCTTEELLALNQQVKENLLRIYQLTDEALVDVTSAVRAQLPILFQLADGIALVDMVGQDMENRWTRIGDPR